LGFAILLANAFSGTNTFGAFWGASIGFTAFAGLTIIVLFTRLAYLSIKGKPSAGGNGT
jgi:hypothetical protein